jgi:[ribosomal protein S5]-alanine N-acetyltransferase
MIISNPICTERLILRSLTNEDVGLSYLDWFQDTEILKYLEVRFSPPNSVKELWQFVKQTNESPNDLLLGIFLKDSFHHIGNIKLGPINHTHYRSDVGFIVGDRNYWGKGFATEAIQAITSYAFCEFNLSKIVAGCYEANIGSARALVKAGFTEEACLESHWLCEGHRENGLLFGRMNPSISPLGSKSE